MLRMLRMVSVLDLLVANTKQYLNKGAKFTWHMYKPGS